MIKEINIFNDPPKLAIKFANTVFVLGILFSSLIIIYAIYQIYNQTPYHEYTTAFYYICTLLSGTFVILFFLGFKLSNNLKINLSLIFFSVGITVLAFETYLEFSKSFRNPYLHKTVDKLFGKKSDIRTPIKVLQDLIDYGLEAYPNVRPRFYNKYFSELRSLNSNSEKIYTLGGISNITTFLDNESGYYPIIETDEHGFNNSRGLYKKNKVDIILTGDSFTEGFSVYADENIAALLRESGFNTISLGKANNGPLLELAALKEYAEPLQPKIVLWIYYENDIHNLSVEINSSFLRKYINEDGFSQDLISRQGEIDHILKNYAKVESFAEELKIEQLKREQKKRKIISNISNKIFRILRLYNLREKIEYVIPLEMNEIIGEDTYEQNNQIDAKQTTLDEEQNDKVDEWINMNPQEMNRYLDNRIFWMFKKILKKSKKLVSTWEGKIYFVYLPSYFKYSEKYVYLEDEYPNHEFILSMVSEVGIPIIDTHTEVFGSHPNPLSLYSGIRAHYNADGYRLVAGVISKRLKDDGIIPLE